MTPPTPPPVLPLWPNGAPGAHGNTDADIPAVTLYTPDPKLASGTAVIICSGGGYDRIDDSKEGIPSAQFLTKLGVTAFVLRYRLAPTPYQYPVMMWDAQRAVRYVRHNAAQYGLKTNQICIMGFSAGGHLASTIATHTDNFGVPTTDAIDAESARPDYQILIYPVITMTPPLAAVASRRHLLGDHPDWETLQTYLSNEKQVTLNTPPAFLVSTCADIIAPCENSLQYYTALRDAAVTGELHIYEKGAHGAGLAPNDPSEGTWPSLLKQWLLEHGLITS
jgi:acetyl esterase/lipase